MFIINSTEGQKSLTIADLKSNLMRVTKSSPDMPIGERDKEKQPFELDYSVLHRNKAAIKSYTDTKKVEQRKVIVTVEEIMTRRVVSVQKNDTLKTAWELMLEHNIHHLPVYNGLSLVGLISNSDILKKITVDGLDKIVASYVEFVEDIMQPKIISIRKNTDIRNVALIMYQYQIGSVLVESEQAELLGIVSKTDLIKRLSEQPPVALYV